MTPERLAELRKEQKDRGWYTQGVLCDQRFDELLSAVEAMQAELARLRRVEEAARAVLESKAVVDYDFGNTPAEAVLYDEELVGKLRKALDG